MQATAGTDLCLCTTMHWSKRKTQP